MATIAETRAAMTLSKLFLALGKDARAKKMPPLIQVAYAAQSMRYSALTIRFANELKNGNKPL